MKRYNAWSVFFESSHSPRGCFLFFHSNLPLFATKDISRELITIWETRGVGTGEWKDNFPHFVTNPLPVIHQQITTSGCIWLCTLISSSWTTSLPGRECVNGVSGLAWFRSGHAGVRWAIDPSQQAFPPGDSSARTAPFPPHAIDFLPWRSAVTAGPDI